MTAVSGFIDVTKHSEYALLRDAYRGAGGFKSGTYLVPHSREQQEDWDDRRIVSYFLNYTKPVIDSHVNPIFRKSIQREGTGAMYDALSLSVDGGGTSIGRFMRRAAMFAKRDSLHFVSVSAPPTAPATVAEAMRGSLPWAYHITTDSVTDIQRDQWGRVASLSWTFMHNDTQLTRTVNGTGWSTADSFGHQIIGDEFAGEWKEKLPFAPVVVIAPNGWDEDEIKPTPEFLAIARANHRIFNLCSELDELIRNTAFPILTYPAKSVSDLTIGTNNAMGYDPSYSHEPAWIAPPAGPADVIEKRIAELVREIYRMAQLSHAIATSNGTTNQSGVAKMLDREGLDSVLSDFAHDLEQAERQLWTLLSWISGTEIPVSVSYPQQFTIGDAEPELAVIASALQIGAGAQFAASARKRMVRVVLSNADEEDLRAIDDEIDGMVQADAQADAAKAEQAQNPDQTSDQNADVNA